MRVAVALGVVLAWAGMTHTRALVWQSDRTLWEDAVRVSPHRARAIIDLGRAIYDTDPANPRVLGLFQAGAREARAASRVFSNDQQADWESLALANEARYWRLHHEYAKADACARAALAVIPLPFAQYEFLLVNLQLGRCRPATHGATGWDCDMPTPPRRSSL